MSWWRCVFFLQDSWPENVIQGELFVFVSSSSPPGKVLLRVLTISQNWPAIENQFLLPEMVSVVASPCDPHAGFTRTTRHVKRKQYGGHGANLQHRMSACSGWFSLLCRAFQLLCVHATKVGENYPVFWINRPSLSLRCFQEPFSHDFVDLWNAQPFTVCKWPHS